MYVGMDEAANQSKVAGQPIEPRIHRATERVGIRLVQHEWSQSSSPSYINGELIAILSSFALLT